MVAIDGELWLSGGDMSMLFFAFHIDSSIIVARDDDLICICGEFE